jgi:hypothetical protein
LDVQQVIGDPPIPGFSRRNIARTAEWLAIGFMTSFPYGAAQVTR